MNKTIILLSGSPAGKNKFAEIVKEISWVWAINPKDYILEKSKLFYRPDNTEKEELYKYAMGQLEILNRFFDFEKSYLKDKIEKFLSDADEFKTTPDGKTFDKFILVAHGVSKDLVSFLQEEYGVFKVHITRKDYNSNENFPSDITVLYEDADEFKIEVNKIIEVLTKGN